MENIKKAAQDALDYNKHLDKVYVSSDAVAFAHKNDAVNHAKNLDDKNIEVFERESPEPEEKEVSEDGATVKPLDAKSLIELIAAAESEEAVSTLLGADKRATVKAAADKRTAELKQAAIDEQAAAADEALKQRENANPGAQEEA